MVITLGNELTEALQDAARRKGVTPETLAIAALRQHFLGDPDRLQPRDDWERKLLAVGTDCGLGLSHLGSEGLYE